MIYLKSFSSNSFWLIKTNKITVIIPKYNDLNEIYYEAHFKYDENNNLVYEKNNISEKWHKYEFYNNGIIKSKITYIKI